LLEKISYEKMQAAAHGSEKFIKIGIVIDLEIVLNDVGSLRSSKKTSKLKIKCFNFRSFYYLT